MVTRFINVVEKQKLDAAFVGALKIGYMGDN